MQFIEQNKVYSVRFSKFGTTIQPDRMIVFNQPLITGNELKYLEEVIASKKLGSDGIFTQKCSTWIEDNIQCKKALLTPSCTHALELAALLLNIQPGDEIISTSFGFVSSANAFVLRGATMVFVDIRTDTLNMNESKIEEAITDKTVAIVPVHYAGVGCNMKVIMEIADKHNLKVVEDAAQGIMSTYDSKPLGSIGHLGTFSFHNTKNYTCGEGGALLINDDSMIERAEILREKGTNRKKFLRGEIDKYSWVDIGSSYLLSELNAAFLWAQLEESKNINEHRLVLWNRYYENLNGVKNIELPEIPENCSHNAHIFYVKTDNMEERSKLISYLNENEVQAVFHYIPLHSAEAGAKFTRFHGSDEYTTSESERLLRLPLYYNLTLDEVDLVCDKIKEYHG